MIACKHKSRRVGLNLKMRVFVLIFGLVSTLCSAHAQSAIAAVHDYSYAHPGIHVVYQDQNNILADYYWLNNSPGWRYAQLKTGPLGATQLVGFSDGQNNHVFAILPVFPQSYNSFVDIWEWYGPMFDTPNKIVYATATRDPSLTYAAIGGSRNCGAIGALQCPDSITSIAGYWDSQVEHIFFTDDNRNVRELYHNGVWYDHPLGGALSSPTMGQGFAAEFDGSIQHVFYAGATNSHVDELYYYNYNWWPNDWTNWGKTVAADNTSYITAGYDSQSKTTQVLAAAQNGTSLQVFRNSATNGFSVKTVNPPNFLSGMPMVTYDYITSPCPATQPACTPGTKLENVYVGTNHQLFEFNGSTATAMTQNSSGSCRPSTYSVKSGSKIAGLYDGNRHIFFINSNSDVMEFFATPNGGWTLNDLSCAAGTFDPAQ